MSGGDTIEEYDQYNRELIIAILEKLHDLA
jgi:hypothetical protein